ncbi:MAG: transcription factor S [Candidatus Hodarchaeaceae archaeon]|nr:transcription factor S [Candidatus Hodarchaeaceae archaeon]
MLPKKIEEGPILVCSGCGYATKASALEGYRLTRTSKERKEPMVVEGMPVTLPTTHTRCPSCGHNKAYWWLRQTRAADEATTRFYRCAKCDHTWREYT